ncbi:MAG: hypothetical protein HFJ12_07665 [Bacilli bacterium]|nr:hypothetical protein [Bacilli bacterium]
MKLSELTKEYDKLQQKYGDPSLNSIYHGGCCNTPDICFVFMNPTGKNVAASKNWNGIKAPWLGTKNIWDLFFSLGLLDEVIYKQIKVIKGSEWTEKFSSDVYNNIKKHKYFITNLGKCTQIDARPLPDSVYLQYLDLLKKEIAIIKPKIIILFGNQVSSIVLNQKISVSQVRKKCFIKSIGNTPYKFYSVYYPVGNGRFNIDKSIEDINWIIENEIVKGSTIASSSL